MKKKIIITVVIFLISNSLIAKNSYLFEGIELFEKEKFEKAKLKFEQDIVVNPKSEVAYLYLSKIFKNLNKKNLQENNLNTVILLNPNNEEAIYDLALLKLDLSDYKKSAELNNRLNNLCKNFCKESQKLKIEIDNLSKK